MLMDTVKTLANEIRQSPEYLEFAAAKESVADSDAGMALIKEYKRLQIALQMSAMAGGGLPPEDMQRFTRISSLLYAGTDTSRYLMAEMRLQKMMGDVLKMLTDAADMQFDLPDGR